MVVAIATPVSEVQKGFLLYTFVKSGRPIFKQRKFIQHKFDRRIRLGSPIVKKKLFKIVELKYQFLPELHVAYQVSHKLQAVLQLEGKSFPICIILYYWYTYSYHVNYVYR